MIVSRPHSGIKFDELSDDESTPSEKEAFEEQGLVHPLASPVDGAMGEGSMAPEEGAMATEKGSAAAPAQRSRPETPIDPIG